MNKLYQHPRLIILVITVITVFFGLQLPHVELDNNNFRFVSENDQARKVSKYIDDTFGSSLFILVALHRNYGDVFDADFLQRIREYVDKVEAIDIIDPVSSIVNADYVTGRGDSIVVEKLLPDDFSGGREEIELLKQKLLSWDMYKKSLISDDFSSTQILVPLSVSNEEAGSPEVVDSFIQVRDIAREMFSGMAEVYVTGIPVISATISEAVRSDLALLVPLVVLVVLAILFFSFRRISGVVLPLLTVAVAAIWSVGAMPLFDIRLSVVSTVLPVILVAVGSAYGIHVITHYLDGQGLAGASCTREEHFRLITGVLHRIRKSVFLAALTTFVGFASFCFTTVLPIREFGIFASFGVLVSFIVAMTLIPAMLIIRGPGKSPRSFAAGVPEAEGSDPISRAIADFFTALSCRRGAIFTVTAVVILLSIWGTSKLVVENVFIEYFRADTDISKSDRFIREQFGGSKVISVVAEADSSEVLLGPESLLAMENLNRYLEAKVPEVGKAMGFTELVKRINQVFNANESPGGLGPSAAAEVFMGTETGFGFEDPFGFGDFGFSGDDTAANAGAAGNDEPGGSGESLADKTYTAQELASLLEKASHSGTVRNLSAADLVWQFKRLLNYDGAAYYEIPADPARYGKTTPEELSWLVSNYLVLLSGSIDKYANDPLEPTAIKSTIQLRTLGELDTDRAIKEIDRFIKANFPDDIRVIVGGSALVESSLNQQVVRSQLISVFVSLILVFLIVAFSNKSAIAGLIGIVPLAIAILINFAVMGFLHIKLNLGTSMIASLAVGIGIDYTIHYMEAYKREYRKGPTGNFLRTTFAISGKAIIINAVSVGAGFAVLLLSRFNMMRDFGLLIALTMATSALVSLTVIPAILLWLNPQFVNRNPGV